MFLNLFGVTTICIILIQKYTTASVFINFHELQTCPEYPNMAFKSNFSIKEINSTSQAISGYLHISADMGEEMKSTMNIFTKIGKQWIQIIKISAKNPCTMANKYFGECWFDLQRRIGIPPGMCPVPKGRYTFDNFFVDARKLKLLLPNGEIKGDTKIFDIYTNELLLCYRYYVTIKNL